MEYNVFLCRAKEYQSTLAQMRRAQTSIQKRNHFCKRQLPDTRVKFSFCDNDFPKDLKKLFQENLVICA